MRVVNGYDPWMQEEGVQSQGRPAQTARWEKIMGPEKILLGGDWNAHSLRLDLQCPPKRDHHFLERLMDDLDLVEVTDGQATHVNARNGET